MGYILTRARDGSGVAQIIDGNYRVITLIFTKYGNLPLCFENYALFSLPPIFTKILYTYLISNILYRGEPSGNIISNDYVTFIHIFMHIYNPINIYIYILNRFFRSMLPFYLPMFLLSCQCYSKNSFIFYQLKFSLSGYH